MRFGGGGLRDKRHWGKDCDKDRKGDSIEERTRPTANGYLHGWF